MANERASARAGQDQQDQAQEQGKAADGFKPSKTTTFLLEDREGLAAPALRFLGKQFPATVYPGAVHPSRVVQKLDCNRLFADREIVVVFLNPNDAYEPQPKPEAGVPRQALQPKFLLSEPIRVADLYQEAADGGGSVQIRNLQLEVNGRVITQPGLCERISRACFVADEYGSKEPGVPTVRAVWRDDDNTLRVTSG